MPDHTPPPRAVHCPNCLRPNVLVVAISTKVASAYCVACEHLFPVDLASGMGALWVEQTPLVPTATMKRAA